MSRGRLFVAIAGIATVALVVLLVAGGPDAGEAPTDPVGFNDNAVSQGVATPTETAELTAEIGGEIDRVQIDWDRLEPQPRRFEWEPYDAIYEADLARGVRPLFIFAYAPVWANGGVCPAAEPACHAAPDTEHIDDAARTAAEIATRYPRAAGIEVWNEPNLPYFWRPRPDPVRYTELLSAVYDAVKREAPEMPVAGGSTTDSLIERPGQITAADFIRGIYANGGGEKMDALSVHAYPDQADPSGLSAVEDVELAREGLGGDRIPIWVTETGITTTGPQAVAPEVQALSLANVTERLIEVPGVEMVLVHTLVRPPGPPESPQPGYGITGPDLAPTRSSCALAEAWGGSGGCAG